MSQFSARRRFLHEVGCGTLLATLGASMALDLKLAAPCMAEEGEESLDFGAMEPMVRTMQETPLSQLQSTLVERLANGVELKTLIAAGALANARTFGGEDYVGFHTFMALAPALRLAENLAPSERALPILKVLYRNTERIQAVGGRPAEVLHPVQGGDPIAQSSRGEEATDRILQRAIQSRDPKAAEQVLAQLMTSDRLGALESLLPTVQENPEVHRTVLPYRAWEMQKIVGTDHALTLLRQSVRYCVKAEAHAPSTAAAQGAMLVRWLEEYRLLARPLGTRTMDDATVTRLSQELLTCSPEDAGRAVASMLADGFAPKGVGEAMALAACQLVLRDGGRIPQWESPGKTAGSVHGDSMGVHASDSANAWRNLAAIGSGRHAMTCVLIGSWQLARDRDQPGNLLQEALPASHHLRAIPATDSSALLSQLQRAIEDKLQSQSAAVAYRYSELGHSPEAIFGLFAKYAVSEDGALHAEKYFQTIWDDYHATRPSLRQPYWSALARVTASEYGTPAAGQEEARQLLAVKS